MTTPVSVTFSETDINLLAGAEGRLAIFVTPDGKMDAAGRRVGRLTKGALARLLESDKWAKMKPGEVATLGWPAGMAASALDVVCLPRNASGKILRRQLRAPYWEGQERQVN